MLSCAKPTGQDVFRRHLALIVAPLLAVFLSDVAFNVGVAPADEAVAAKGQLVSSSDRSSGTRLTKLIDQLGDELFAVREEATNQLIRSGIEAKPLLLAALASSDAEVRFRAKRVLEIVVEGDFQRRLKAFAEDVDGSRNLSMPGWKAFKEFVGDDRTARALFVEIQQAEPMLMEAYESGPEVAVQSLAERLRTLQSNVNGRIVNQRNRRVFVSGVAVPPSLGTSLAMLLVGGDETLAVQAEVADRFGSTLTPVEVRAALQSGDDRGQLCRKIAGRWIRRELSDTATYSNLSIALQLNLPDGLEPAINTLKKGNAPNKNLRSMAALTVGNHGGKEHLPLVEPLLKDNEILFNNQINVRAVALPNQPAAAKRVAMQTQIRDVALVVTIKLSGQDPSQFGFELLKQADQKQLQLQTAHSRMGFPNEEDRLAAFQKWEEWQKGQQQAAAKKPKSDTVER